MDLNHPGTIKKILEETRTIAVVGLSSNPMRPSFEVSSYVQSQGYRIIPVNPREREVLGEPAYPTLADVPERIDLVNIFRRSKEAGHHVDEAIRLGIPAVWLQDGVIDEEAAQRAASAGLHVIMDRCILREHLRHSRGSGWDGRR